MARMNISIPDELKASMDKLSINWSAIAQDSFTHAVEIAKLQESNMELDAGIARLRESKKRNSEREHADGVADGKQWALDCAEYDDLKGCAATLDLAENNGDAASYLFGLIQERGLDIDQGAREIEDDYALGFLEGAVQVYRQV